MDEDDGPEVDVLLLGDADVGKTAFLNRLLLGPQAADNTLNDSNQPFVLKLRHNRGAHRLHFSDTAAPESYLLHRPHLIVLCYDVSRVSTLRSAQTHWKRLADATYNADERHPVLLLGLKRDLRVREENPRPRGEAEDPAVQRSVMPQEGVRFAQEMRCDRYVECSARTGDCWDVCVQDVLALAVQSARGRAEAGHCAVM